MTLLLIWNCNMTLFGVITAFRSFKLSNCPRLASNNSYCSVEHLLDGEKNPLHLLLQIALIFFVNKSKRRKRGPFMKRSQRIPYSARLECRDLICECRFMKYVVDRGKSVKRPLVQQC